MCGRIAQYDGIREFVDALSGMPQREQFRMPLEPRERYNLTRTSPVAVLHVDGHTLLADVLPWGWKPHWADGALQINARAERVATNPFWRAAWPRRCILPANGWYEWPRIPGGGPKDKQAHYIRMVGGVAPVLMAGIGAFPGLDAEVHEGHGVAVITADSEGGMVDVHDRRPVALSPELAQEWLDPATPKERAAEIIRQGLPAEAFEWYKVDKAVGNVRNEGPQLIQPLRTGTE